MLVISSVNDHFKNLSDQDTRRNYRDFYSYSIDSAAVFSSLYSGKYNLYFS